jgi:hypothetical protein
MLETREGGCHCGRVRFRTQLDLDLLSQCSCTICTKKGILHLPATPEDFQLLRGKSALKVYTFGTGMAQHTFCGHCGMHAFYIPRSAPHRISVNARCLDGIDGPSLKRSASSTAAIGRTRSSGASPRPAGRRRPARMVPRRCRRSWTPPPNRRRRQSLVNHWHRTLVACWRLRPSQI